MLVEIIQNSATGETNSTDSLSGYVRMERPKSAKYNLERYKKSSSNASRFNKAHTNYIENINETNNENVESPQIDENNLINKRFQGSKSAYVGNMGRLRPQSARHNLDKYRQDVYREQQLKLQKLQQLQQNDSQIIETNIIVNKEAEPLYDQEDDLDDLEGLLIGEEDSTSELDSNDSLSNTDLTLTKTKNKKLNKLNKKKLLSKRTGNNPVITVGPQVILNNQNLPNKTANLNMYTTFRPTAVTTNYSTSLKTNNLKVVHLHPEKEYENLDQTNGSINTTTTTNSSSSSSSSSSKLQPILQEQPENMERNRYRNSHIDSTSRELLQEWLKNDDEIDLNVNNAHDDDVIDENLIYQSKYQKNPNLKTNRLVVHRAQVSGRTTRSDYSSNSSYSQVKTESSISYNREKSTFIDPWAKRNPTLIAQNVLLKHRAELEQLTASRAINNNSRTSNTPSVLSHSTHTANSLNRCLLPDTKYFKK